MMLPVQITTRDVELSPAEEAAVRQAAAKLESFSGRIVSCRVSIDMPRRRGRTGRLYSVRIDLKLPQRELVIRRQQREQLLTAVQDAFDAAARRIQDRVRRVRPTPPSQRASRATVARLLPWEGYGFLVTEDEREIYFDRKSVRGDGFDRLEEGMQVRFVEESGEQGPQASSVVPGSRRRPAGGRTS